MMNPDPINFQEHAARLLEVHAVEGNEPFISSLIERGFGSEVGVVLNRGNEKLIHQGTNSLWIVTPHAIGLPAYQVLAALEYCLRRHAIKDLLHFPSGIGAQHGANARIELATALRKQYRFPIKSGIRRAKRMQNRIVQMEQKSNPWLKSAAFKQRHEGQIADLGVYFWNHYDLFGKSLPDQQWSKVSDRFLENLEPGTFVYGQALDPLCRSWSGMNPFGQCVWVPSTYAKDGMVYDAYFSNTIGKIIKTRPALGLDIKHVCAREAMKDKDFILTCRYREFTDNPDLVRAIDKGLIRLGALAMKHSRKIGYAMYAMMNIEHLSDEGPSEITTYNCASSIANVLHFQGVSMQLDENAQGAPRSMIHQVFANAGFRLNLADGEIEEVCRYTAKNERVPENVETCNGELAASHSNGAVMG